MISDCKVALLQCGDHFENQMRILPLALQLRRLGYRVYPLMYSPSKSSRLFENFEFEALYLDKISASTDQYHLSEENLDEIVRVEKLRFPFKYTASKIKAEKEKVKEIYFKLKKILSSCSISILGIWNGFTGNVANCLRVISKQSNIDCFFMERSIFDGALFIDSEGVNGSSSLSSLNHIVNMDHLDKTPLIKGAGLIHDEFRLPESLQEKEFVFLPMQVQTDTNTILYSDYVKSVRRFVLAVLRSIVFVREQTGRDLVLVVREHPEEVEKQLNLPKSDLIYYINTGPIPVWCKHAQAIATINSTVGLEGIFFGVPVVCVGKSIYSGKGICLDVDLQGIAQAFIDIVENSWKPNIELVQNYMKKLYLDNTADFNNLPGFLGGSMSCCGYGLVAENIVNEIRVLSENRLIRLGVLAKKLPELNLTYRNISQTLGSDICARLFSSHFMLSLEDFSVERIVEKNLSGLDVIVVPRCEYNAKIMSDFKGICLDEYLLPY